MPVRPAVGQRRGGLRGTAEAAAGAAALDRQRRPLRGGVANRRGKLRLVAGGKRRHGLTCPGNRRVETGSPQAGTGAKCTPRK